MPANRFVLCSAIVTLLLCTSTSTAQSQSQPLTVHVGDPSGAPVRGARLVLSSRDGRLQITRATDPSGDARFEPSRARMSSTSTLRASRGSPGHSSSLRNRSSSQCHFHWQG
jgi:hypothetical protein